MTEDYVTHREFTAVKELTERWLAAEFRLRDRAVEIADLENKAQMVHLNDLRQGVVTRLSFERETETINVRLKALEDGKNKILGAILLLTAIGVANLVKLFW